jgi:K+-sensing histidine kinase KdpD
MSHRRISIGLGAESSSGWLGLAASLLAVAVGVLLVLALKSVAEPVSLGVVFIPGVLLLSTIWGLRFGLLTAVLSAVAFNWFYIPPVGRLDIADKHDFVAFLVFAIVAVAAGTLAELARARARESERRREEADRALADLKELERERDRMQAEVIEGEALRRSDELNFDATSLRRLSPWHALGWLNWASTSSNSALSGHAFSIAAPTTGCLFRRRGPILCPRASEYRDVAG